MVRERVAKIVCNAHTYYLVTRSFNKLDKTSPCVFSFVNAYMMGSFAIQDECGIPQQWYE